MIRKASIKNIIPSLIALYLVSFTWGFIIIAIIIAEILARICFNFSPVRKKTFQKELVSITIVNWNSKQYIENCLDAIKKQRYPHIEVIIVDNNSNDGSLEYIAEYVLRDFNRVKVVKNDSNMLWYTHNYNTCNIIKSP